MLKEKSLWLLPLNMVVTAYFCYEKVRRTMRTAIVLNLLKVNVLLIQRISISEMQLTTSKCLF